MKLDLDNFHAQQIAFEGVSVLRLIPRALSSAQRSTKPVGREEIDLWLQQNKGRLALGARVIMEYTCSECGEYNTVGFHTLQDMEESHFVQKGACARCLVEVPGLLKP